MDWLFPSVVATLTGTLVLMCAFLYLYYIDRERSMKVWTVSWFIYAGRFVFFLLILKQGKSDLLLIANQLSALTSGVLLLWGTYIWAERKMAKFWFAAYACAAAWIFISVPGNYSFHLLALPAFVFSGIVFIWTGIVFMKYSGTGGPGKNLAGIVFILWGVHKIDYPFLKPVTWFAPWGYLLGALFSLLAALGIILIYFEKAKERLSESLHEKDVLLMEIHHRVKNNMQIISSLLNLQALYSGNKEVKEIITESEKRVRSMALVHESLYRSDRFAEINIQNLVDNMVRDFYSSFTLNLILKFDVKMKNIAFNIETAIPVALIINELLSNSVKHAFSDGEKGNIEVDLFDDNGIYTLSYRDNGSGIPENIDIDKSETLGLQLVRSLVKQLSGTVEINTGNGTEFVIRFKKISTSGFK